MDYLDYNFKKFLQFKNPADAKILEIGPGLGESVCYLNNKKVFNIDILDNDESILKNLKEKFKINNTFLSSTPLGEVDNKLGSYDAIIATQIFEHIPKEEYSEFLRITYSHLKIGGYLIITVPNMANPFTTCERYADITHENGFTDNSLHELAHQGNISDIKIKIQEFNIPPYSFLNIIRIILQKILHFFILVLSIINGGSYSKLLTPNITLIIQK